MTFLLLSVITAASLVTAGSGATGEIRSAQSLPVEHLAVVRAPATGSGGSVKGMRLIKAGAKHLDQGTCASAGGSWNITTARCGKKHWSGLSARYMAVPGAAGAAGGLGGGAASTTVYVAGAVAAAGAAGGLTAIVSAKHTAVSN